MATQLTNVMTEEQLQDLINSRPAEKVERSYIESRITNVSYFRISETVTICNIELDNGYSVRGESACVKPENYDEQIGSNIAYNNAFQKLWPLFGFLLAENGTLKK